MTDLDAARREFAATLAAAAKGLSGATVSVSDQREAADRLLKAAGLLPAADLARALERAETELAEARRQRAAALEALAERDATIEGLRRR